MILGVTGTDGAGKGTVVALLVSKHGYTHYSSREFIVAEIERQGLPVTRNQMRLIANEMRAQYGNDFVVRQAFERAQEEGKSSVVIESVRTIAEAEYLKAHGGLLLSVDADPEVRYARVQKRRSASDQVTYEQFLAHEELEKNDPDAHGMQKAKVMEMADYTISNGGTIEALEEAVRKALQELGSM